MINSLKFYTILLLSFILNIPIIPIHADSNVNIKSRLKIQKYYKKIYPVIFGKSDYALKSEFIKLINTLKEKEKSEALELIGKLQKHLPYKILAPLVYWRVIKKNTQKTKEVIKFLMLNKLLVLRDAIDTPFFPNKNQAQNILSNLTGRELTTMNFFELLEKDLEEKSQLISQLKSLESFIEGLLTTKIITFNLNHSVHGISSYTLSYLGIIPGNKVQLINSYDRSLERINWFKERTLTNTGKLNIKNKTVKTYTSNQSKENTIIQKDPIITKIKEMIERAKDSIFIDIFLMGGNLGLSLSKYLLDQAKEKIKINPEFKVLILHNPIGYYNKEDEIIPLFTYLRERIETEEELKNRVLLLASNTQKTLPSTPFNPNHFKSNSLHLSQEIRKINNYGESKIDHSKIIVIDANTDQPMSCISSKNWIDHRGGYDYDDAITIEGPAAAIIQANYYEDVESALEINKKYSSRKKEILNWFQVKKTNYPTVGNDSIHITQTDAKGIVKNTRNILIDMIIKAEDHIYMEHLFLYDPYIIDALIKRKIEVPSLDIKILVDHNESFNMNGFPNTIFLKELKSYGIKVRARKTHDVESTLSKDLKQKYYQLNHRKITSIDGQYLLLGSSNINPSSLQGNTREFGIKIYNTNEIKRFETSFLKDWSNNDWVVDLDIENFKAKAGSKVLNKKTSKLLNDIAAQLLRVKDQLERRY